MIQINDKKSQEGDIISFTNNGYILSKLPYDPTAFGVITDNPSITLENPETTSAKPVISSGKSVVRVSTINGPIKAHDLLTTSSIPGVAQKATADGHVIGTALENFTNSDPHKIGKILVSLNFGFSTQPSTSGKNLLENLKVSLSSPFLSPLTTLRYVFAGIISLVAFVLGIRFFHHVSSTGVEAIGRNPLAGRLIIVSILLNIFVTFGIIATGLAIAYLILIL